MPFSAVVGEHASGAAWTLGFVSFAPLRLPPAANPLMRFFALLALSLTLLTVYSALTAGGEEIGWRGYLVPRLVESGAPAPDVLTAGSVGIWDRK